MPASEIDSVSSKELETLMREFPDWKEQFPEIYEELNPPRYSKHNRKDKQKQDRVMPRKSGKPSKTDYQATYIGYQTRPRSTKRPPPSPRDPNPPPMKFDTNQRAEFTPKDLSTKAELIKQGENYEPPNGAVESRSQYQLDYPGHFVLPEIQRAKAEDQKGNKRRVTGKFSSATTTNDHYKKWVPDKCLQFGELPTFTDSLLYPSKNRYMESTNMLTFKGVPGKKPEMARMSDGNIKLEGDTDFCTTNNQTYKTFDGARPAERMDFRGEISVAARSKFASQTQTMKDFGAYKHGMPRPQKAAVPAPETIDLRFDNRHSFDTEQRKQYQGIDTGKFKMAEPFAPEDKTYRVPTERFETQTSQKMDYRPIDVTQVYKPPQKAPADHGRPDKQPKLDDRTMNNHFFKKWDVEPRKIYGDFHEAHTYVAPSEKFNTVSTNQETYGPKEVSLRPTFKPEDKGVRRDGAQDFNTVYSKAFTQPGLTKNLTKQQKALLYRELKKRTQGIGLDESARCQIHAN